MIEYLKTFFTFPWVGAGWMLVFVAFVAGVIALVAVIKKDVPGITDPLGELKTFLDRDYLLFCLFQQILSVTVFYWSQYFGMSFQAAQVTGALAFGVVGHFLNRGLMGWCTAMAFAYLAMWSVFHNLPILWIGHFFLSKVYRRFTPETFNEGMRVWFFQWKTK